MKKFHLSALAKFALILGSVLLISAFTEEGDSKDINDKLIATTIAVDKKDGEIWFYVEFANIQQSSSGGSGGGGGGGASKKYFVVKGHGRTLPEARNNINRQLDKPIYISGVRTLLLTERFAKEHLVEYLYRLRADETYRKKVITMITRDDLDALYKALNDQDLSLGYSAENTLTTLEALGDCFSRTTSRLLENLSDTYTGILLPCIGLEDNQTALTGYSVVNDDRVTGFIPIEACRGLNFLKADRPSAYYVVPYDGDQYTVQVKQTSRNIRTRYEYGRPFFDISMKIDASLEYGDLKTPYNFDDADNEALTARIKQLIKQDVMDAVYQAQTAFHTDYLQMDDAFRVTFPVVYDTMDWNVAFEQAMVTVEADVSLKPSSMIDYAADVAR